ncbi:hypothetical protein ACFCX4_23945 [Kitasatospora sp. NPDC056327]|uniref:hypothetical protein n=1 Tax=Kitasatospora sp. NPDC056327 TaxID=3345785 RepID=UPI0035D7C858
MDTRGDAARCRAPDESGVRVFAEVTGVQNWSEAVRTDYGASPACRDVLRATSSSLDHEAVRCPAVAEFRAAVAHAFPDREPLLSAWEPEGRAGAQRLADAMGPCGADLIRACVERFMNRPEPYDAQVCSCPPPSSRGRSRPGPSGRGPPAGRGRGRTGRLGHPGGVHDHHLLRRPAAAVRAVTRAGHG